MEDLVCFHFALEPNGIRVSGNKALQLHGQNFREWSGLLSVSFLYPFFISGEARLGQIQNTVTCVDG